MAKEIESYCFSNEEMSISTSDLQTFDNKPVTCLGKEFPNEEVRRQYFREELRKKLPELRSIEGFPIGTDDDIINLSDPPYYTACPNPWLNDFITEWEEQKEQLETEGKRRSDFEVKEPYASDVSEGKYNPLYLLHPYLTKVPYPAIVKYLEHYTQPGDIILDGFAGTGMTGAAARLCNSGKRSAICLDLSPLATFISSFVNSNESKDFFAKVTKDIINSTKKELGWMLSTNHTNGQKGEISYVIWSNVYVCPSCGEEVIFYDVAFDKKTGNVSEVFNCPNCNSSLTKNICETAMITKYDNSVNDHVCEPKRVPVQIGYTYNKKRFQKKPDQIDLDTIKKIDEYKITYWVPTDEIIDGDEISRAKRDGIKYFEQYYSKRNLAILCKIKSLLPKPLYNCLITKVAFQSTIMYRYCTKGGGPMSGTMYVPALIKEVNIFNQLDSFVKDRSKIIVSNDINNIATSTQSSTSLSFVKDNSIDYIFTDPPFGKNFMYSELNYISEMWLKVKTNNSEECIESNSQDKNVLAYQRLIQRVFSEYYRVLKPGKWFSIEFSNTSAAIWNAIQNAITSVGFIISNVSALDKKKESYKAVTTTTAVKQDLVISCYKPSDKLHEKFQKSGGCKENVWDFIDEHLLHLPVHIEKGNATTSVIERSPKILFDRLISYYVQKGYSIPMDAQEFQKGLRDRYEERDGMIFTPIQVVEYDEKKKNSPTVIPMGIIISDEANGIQWLKNQLRDNPQTYQDIQPEWNKASIPPRKGDKMPELLEILNENFIKMEDGKWRLPNIQDDVDKEAMRTKSLLKEFKVYVDAANKPKSKIKEARVEALRAGFKQCYIDKDFQTIVTVGNKIPQALRDEDEVLLQFYEIALNKI